MNESGATTRAPDGYIGSSAPRSSALRLLRGRGSFVDDIALRRMVHVAFLRSPYAHARIDSIDASAALASPGVVAVFDGQAIAELCTPWVGVLANLKGLRSAPQLPLAVDVARWQGEAVVAVVAQSRAQAEDAVALVEVEWTDLPAVVEPVAALENATPLVHPSLGSNLAYERRVEVGEIGVAFAGAHAVVEETLVTSRHTGVCLEPRSVVADFDPGDGKLTVYASSQVPRMFQSLLAKHLDIAEADVRVICRDVGGAFGIKVHLYADEVATAAISVKLKRPVKFIADRLESFVTDVHARDHRVAARIAISREGDIIGFDIDDVSAIGAYSVYPRGSANEVKQIANLAGAAYHSTHYRARARLAFQNKTPLGQYRSVGHPVACLITEVMVDRAARILGMDPVDFRRRNLVPDDAYPRKTLSGVDLEGLSHRQCLEKLVELIDYASLRADQVEKRRHGVYRGIGLATYIEMTNPSHATYGIGGAPISSQDGCTVQLLPSGAVACATGTTEQGQGSDAVVAQIVATAVGVPLEDVRVTSGDTQSTPFGGGTWGSRSTGIGGEAALQAGLELRRRLLEVAGVLTQADPVCLDIRGGAVFDKATGMRRMTVAEVGNAVYFRNDLLPEDFRPELVATRHYRQCKYDGIASNGIQASLVEVDVETGFVSLLRHWAVVDCGTIINPQLLDEQIRGGIVQGLGAALLEEILYSAEGQLLNGSLADYLVPMAGEMPDIAVAHVVTPTLSSELGAKGAGEAGTAGASAAVLNAVNDALAPFNAQLNTIPLTPERVLRALGYL